MRRGRRTDAERASTHLELANWESFPVEEKTMSATSASQSTESSSAFLKSPRRRLENVTCRAAALSILFISRRSLAIVPADPSPPPTQTPPRRPRAEHRRTTSREAEAEEAGAAASQPAVGAVM